MTLVPRLLRDRPVAACLVLVAATSLFFIAFPQVDLWFSELFHRNRGGFWLRKNDVLTVFRATNDILIAVVVIALFTALVMKLAKPDRSSPIAPNVVVFLLSTLIAGPLLLVNVVLKNNWGRPRPVQVDAFGGDAPYVGVWQITDWCETNCSFVSGEASSAIWLVAVALVLPAAMRPAAVVVAAVYAVLLSVNRIAFGGHFLSDVAISFALTLLVIAVLHRLVISHPPDWLRNDRMEAALTRWGYRLRGREPA